MDPLRRDDIEHARRTPPEEKLRQALEMMRTGIRLKRAGLKARHPQATVEEIEVLIGDWLSVSAEGTAPEEVLGEAAAQLRRLGIPFALVGGLAIAVRGEPRFTQDVDLAIHRADDASVEKLVRDLSANGYAPFAVLEHEVVRRIATVRLRSRSGVVVDLLVASCGIEPEIIARASPIEVEEAGVIPVARGEELLAMKILSMRPARRHDRDDALTLLEVDPTLDLDRVRRLFALIRERGFDRGEDLDAKLAELLAERE